MLNKKINIDNSSRIFIDNTVIGYQHYFADCLKNKICLYSPSNLEKILNSSNLDLSDIYNIDPINNKDIFIIRSKVIIKKNKIKQFPGFIGSTVSGTDHLDLDYLDKKGVNVFCATGCNSESVRNYIIAVLIKLNYDLKLDLFNHKSYGIIGFGNIGKLVVNWLDSFGCNIKIYDPFIKSDINSQNIFKNKESIEFVKNINDLSSCDVISMHCSLTKSSLGLITDDFLKKLKKHTVLINSARGESIDTSAILNNTHINYVFDVWPGEPKISKDLIKVAKIATPHIAGHSWEGKINGLDWVYKYLIKINSINSIFKLKDRSKPIFINNNIKYSNLIKKFDSSNIELFYKKDFILGIDLLFGLSDYTKSLKFAEYKNIEKIFKKLRSGVARREK